MTNAPKIPTGPLHLRCSASIQAANDNDGANTVPKLTVVAYTGGPMLLNDWSTTPVVMDLRGVTFAAKNIPVRLEHDKAQGVGHIESFTNDGRQLTCEGRISRDTPAARDVVASAKNGFPWQASVGARANEVQYIPEGTDAKVNGQTIPGPLYLATKIEVYEISLTELGADSNTSATIAATAATNLETNTMPDPVIVPPVIQASNNDAAIESARIQAAAKLADETNRISAINALEGPAEIKATAIKNGCTPEHAELLILRASRPTAPSGHTIEGHSANAVIECAFAQSTKMPGVEKAYRPEIMEAAHTAYRGRLGLQQALIAAARQNGWRGDTMRGNERDVIRAAFSTQDISGILSNIANKFLLAGFMAVEQSWRKVAAVRPVNDFKTVTSYRPRR